MYSPEVIRETFKRYLRNDCRHFNPGQRSAMLVKFDESIKLGNGAYGTFETLLDEYGNHGADEVLAKYHASGSLLNDKEKSRYQEYVERLQKKFKMDKLSLVGMEETPVAPTPTKDNNLKTSPEIAIGKQITFNNKSFKFELEIH